MKEALLILPSPNSIGLNALNTTVLRKTEEYKSQSCGWRFSVSKSERRTNLKLVKDSR